MSDHANTQQVAVQQQPRPARQITVVEDAVPMLDTARFEHMQRVAGAMARASLIPSSLRGSGEYAFEETLANCFLVVNQAVRWGMDPFAVAQSVFVLHGKIGYEGKLIAAMLEAKTGNGLDYEWIGQPGDGDKYGIVVKGKRPSDGKEVSISGTVGDWKTFEKDGKNIKANWRGLAARNQLAYRGAREWARLYAPALMLGVYTHDEMEDLDEDYRFRNARDITVREEAPGPDEPGDAKAAAPRKRSNKYQEQSSGETVDPSTGEITGGEQQKPEEKPAEQKQAVEEKATEKPAEKKADKPAEKPKDKPAEEKPKPEQQQTGGAKAEEFPNTELGLYMKKLDAQLAKCTTRDELKAVWNTRAPWDMTDDPGVKAIKELRDRHKQRVDAPVEEQKTEEPPAPDENAPGPDDGPTLESLDQFDFQAFMEVLGKELDAATTAEQVSSLYQLMVTPRIEAGLITEAANTEDIMPKVDAAMERIGGFDS